MIGWSCSFLTCPAADVFMQVVNSPHFAAQYETLLGRPAGATRTSIIVSRVTGFLVVAILLQNIYHWIRGHRSG
ncbi:MAG: hypothetical protein AB1331_00705 [Bacillota bacterium]